MCDIAVFKGQDRAAGETWLHHNSFSYPTQSLALLTMVKTYFTILLPSWKRLTAGDVQASTSPGKVAHRGQCSRA
jgi:hypothetical protein